MTDPDLKPLLIRIAEALERMAPPPPVAATLTDADAFVWEAEAARLLPIARVARVELELLRGVDRVRDILLENTERFAKGLPATI